MQFLEVIKGKLIEQCLGIFTTTISRASQDVNWHISRAWKDLKKNFKKLSLPFKHCQIERNGQRQHYL